MKRIILIVMLLFPMARMWVTYAQEDIRLYVRNDSLVEVTYKNLIDGKYYGQPDTIRIPYMEAIREAFEMYWKDKSTRSNVQPSKLEQLKNNVMTVTQDTLTASQDLHNVHLRNDSIRVAILQLNGEMANVDTNENDTLSAEIASVGDTILICAAQMGELRTQLLTLMQQRDSLLNISTLLANTIQANDSLAEARHRQLDTSQDLSSTAQAQRLLLQLQNDLQKMNEACRDSLACIDVDEASRVVKQFDDNASILAAIDPVAHSEAQDCAMHIRAILTVAAPLQAGVRQMNGAFQADKNNEYLVALETAEGRGKLSTAQEQEREAVSNALRGQEQAYNWMIYLLNYTEIESTSPDFDISETIDAIIGMATDGKTEFFPFYGRFNTILTELREDYRDIPKLRNELSNGSN